jgi:hypothetical protein
MFLGVWRWDDRGSLEHTKGRRSSRREMRGRRSPRFSGNMLPNCDGGWGGGWRSFSKGGNMAAAPAVRGL